jgi:hypothetical protein
LRSLVSHNADSEDENEAEEEGDGFFRADSEISEGEVSKGKQALYSTEIEPCMVNGDEDDETADTSDLKQVEIKLLDFNWAFIGTNAERFIEILAETDNDDIFTSSQIRVLIEFLWDGYF